MRTILFLCLTIFSGLMGYIYSSLWPLIFAIICFALALQPIFNHKFKQAESLLAIRKDLLLALKNVQDQIEFRSKPNITLVFGLKNSGKSVLLEQMQASAIANPLNLEEEEYFRIWKLDQQLLLEVSPQVLPFMENLDTATAWWSLLTKTLQPYCHSLQHLLVVNISTLHESHYNDMQDNINHLSYISQALQKHAEGQLIFTHADTIYGFKEFFSGLSPNIRCHPWSLPLVEPKNRQHWHTLYQHAFSQSMDDIQSKMIDRIHHETDPKIIAHIKEFPLQLLQLKEPIQKLCTILLGTQPNLSHIYWTSSRQSQMCYDYLSYSMHDLPSIVQKNDVNTHYSYFIQKLADTVLNAPSPEYKHDYQKWAQVATFSMILGFFTVQDYTWLQTSQDQSLPWLTKHLASWTQPKKAETKVNPSYPQMDLMAKLLHIQQYKFSHSQDYQHWLILLHQLGQFELPAEQLSKWLTQHHFDGIKKFSKDDHKQIKQLFPQFSAIFTKLSLQEKSQAFFSLRAEQGTAANISKLCQLWQDEPWLFSQQPQAQCIKQLQSPGSSRTTANDHGLPEATSLLEEWINPNSKLRLSLSESLSQQSIPENAFTDELHNTLEQLHQRLQKINQSSNSDLMALNWTMQRFANQGQHSQDLLTRLSNIAEKAPQPLQKALQQCEQTVWQGLMLASQKIIDKNWHEQVYTYFNHYLANRYPINIKSDEDISLEHFRHFFANEQGILIPFFNRYLTPFIEQNDKSWTWKTLDQAKLHFKQASLNTLMQGMMVHLMFFSKDSDALELDFTLLSDQWPERLQQLILNYGSETTHYTVGHHTLTHHHWPLTDPAGKLSLTAVDQNNQGIQKTIDGPWAIFRLLELAQDRKSKSEEGIQPVSVTLSDLTLTFQLMTEKEPNPFAALEHLFHCPEFLS
jgi:type VI protein secretion system component VasK